MLKGVKEMYWQRRLEAQGAALQARKGMFFASKTHNQPRSHPKQHSHTLFTSFPTISSLFATTEKIQIFSPLTPPRTPTDPNADPIWHHFATRF